MPLYYYFQVKIIEKKHSKLITEHYFLGIHCTSSAFKSWDNFRANTKR